MSAGGGAARDAIAEIRREFAAGLPDRLAAMRTALNGLARGFDKALAETFFLKTHSLKGTAASFGANEVATIVTELTERGRRWVREGALKPNDVSEALPELERLTAAVDRYRARVDAGEVQ